MIPLVALVTFSKFRVAILWLKLRESFENCLENAPKAGEAQSSHDRSFPGNVRENIRRAIDYARMRVTGRLVPGPRRKSSDANLRMHSYPSEYIVRKSFKCCWSRDLQLQVYYYITLNRRQVEV